MQSSTNLSLKLEDFEKIATGIQRPEDVVVSKQGRVFASDHLGTVAEIHTDGSFTTMGPKGGAPNGINMDAQGRVIIANFGIYDQEVGPLQRFNVETGQHETLVTEVEGVPLTSCNYPIIAKDGTIWCTHSTNAETWPQALDGRDDGFIFAYLPDGTVNLAATGLKFANGCALDQDEQYLYVNQTSGFNVVRYPIIGPGQLGERENYGPDLGVGLDAQQAREYDVNASHDSDPQNIANLGYTDGNGFDIDGNLWVTLPAANKVVAITPAQEVVTVVQDLTGEIIDHPTNVTWGGDDMRDLYIGSIRANYVLKVRSPVAGMPLIHQR